MAFTALEHRFVTDAVERFLERIRPPAHIRPELDFVARIDGQSVAIFEVRPKWRGPPGEVTEHPVAKATYVRRQDHWRVYWVRRDLKWHPHPFDDTAASLADVFDLVEKDEYACFFG